VVISQNHLAKFTQVIALDVPVALADLIFSAGKAANFPPCQTRDVTHWTTNSASEIVAFFTWLEANGGGQEVLMTDHAICERLATIARCEMEGFAPSVLIEILWQGV
jgi:hypothetical protein